MYIRREDALKKAISIELEDGKTEKFVPVSEILKLKGKAGDSKMDERRVELIVKKTITNLLCEGLLSDNDIQAHIYVPDGFDDNADYTITADEIRHAVQMAADLEEVSLDCSTGYIPVVKTGDRIIGVEINREQTGFSAFVTSNDDSIEAHAVRVKNKKELASLLAGLAKDEAAAA